MAGNNNDNVKRGAHAKLDGIEYIDKSARMRKVLVIVIILLILLIAAIVFFGVQMFAVSQDAATQQTQIAGNSQIDSDDSDKDTTTTKKTTVPDLIEIIGMTEEQAIEALGHGAEVSREIEVNEEGNPAKKDVQIVLTEEPSVSQTGTPTVYLLLDEAGAIIRAGYSVATSSIGYGTVSFSDAVMNEHIVENTLGEAGLKVEAGSVKLPADKMLYSTYDSDGTTLVKEYCSFAGDGTANGAEYSWEAILSYDYSMANATDNLNDTIRTIYVYISRK